MFLDIRMPGMDGVEAAERFAELPKAPYVIFTTAYEEYAAKAFELGAADYLLKPISKGRLEKALMRAWELQASAGAARRSGGARSGAKDSAHPGVRHRAGGATRWSWSASATSPT